MQASDERLDRGLWVAREEALQDASTLDGMRMNEQVAAFDAAFLQTFSQMVQGFGHPVL